MRTPLACAWCLLAACGAAGPTDARGEAPETRSEAPETLRLDAIGWLAGEWRAMDGARQTSEVWVPLEDGAWLGLSHTSTASATTHHEVLRLAETGGAVHYIAAPIGQATTSFRMVSASSTGARFENPAHDFPKWIAYRRQGNAVVAAIGGEGSEVAASWRFEPVERAAGTAEIAARLCRDGDVVRVTLPPCYCSAELFCAGFAGDDAVDLHLAVVDRSCDACMEAEGSCAVPPHPIRTVNGRATARLSDGCIDATVPVVTLASF